MYSIAMNNSEALQQQGTHDIAVNLRSTQDRATQNRLQYAHDRTP
jgi:hypothetical protein